MHRTKKIKSHKPVHRKRRNTVVQCLNCSKMGHLYRDCRFPLTSYGILLFRYNKELNDVQYLMICRRHTFGYVEFIRACYEAHSTSYVKQLLMEMTIHERTKIQTFTFKELWLDLWQQKTTYYNHEYVTALNAFNRLMDSNMCKELLRTLADSVWTTPEWGFPKGKRNVSESPMQCAVREMQEESGLMYNQGYKEVERNSSVPTQVTEIFKSTDKRIYRHVYYIYTHRGVVDYVFNEKNRMQMREVSDISWFTYTECLAHIRCYNVAKRKMLTDLHPTIVQYCESTHNTKIIMEHTPLHKEDACCKQTEHTSVTHASHIPTHDDGKDSTCHKATNCQQTVTTDDQHRHPVHTTRTLQSVS